MEITYVNQKEYTTLQKHYRPQDGDEPACKGAQKSSIRNENGTSKNRELQPAAEDMDKALSTVLAQPHPADEPPVPDTESTAAVVGLSCAEQEKPCSSSYVVAIPTAGIPLTQVIRIFH